MFKSCLLIENFQMTTQSPTRTTRSPSKDIARKDVPALLNNPETIFNPTPTEQNSNAEADEDEEEEEEDNDPSFYDRQKLPAAIKTDLVKVVSEFRNTLYKFHQSKCRKIEEFTFGQLLQTVGFYMVPTHTFPNGGNGWTMFLSEGRKANGPLAHIEFDPEHPSDYTTEAQYIWASMSKEEKKVYSDKAIESKETRTPVSTACEGDAFKDRKLVFRKYMKAVDNLVSRNVPI